MFAVNICMFSVVGFCHYLLCNIVKNLPLLTPVVSALCCCFLGFIGTSLFSFSSSQKQQLTKSFSVVRYTSGLATDYGSFGLLLHSV